MSRTLNLTRLKDALKIIIVSLLGCSGIVFVVLYIDAFNVGFWYDYSTHLTAISVSIITTLTVLAITFFKSSNKIIFKLSFLSIVFILITMLSLYLFKISGLLDNFNNVKDFKEYIKSFEQYAIVLFVLVQFLQVVALPIPSFITVAAGVLLFGPLKAAMYSSVGIILGSIVAYFIGRVFGVKVVKWLVGENNLKKGLNQNGTIVIDLHNPQKNGKKIDSIENATRIMKWKKYTLLKKEYSKISYIVDGKKYNTRHKFKIYDIEKLRKITKELGFSNVNFCENFNIDKPANSKSKNIQMIINVSE